MKIKNTVTPVVIINCKLAALGIMRSLGSMGVTIYSVDADRRSPGILSRYHNHHFPINYNENNPQTFLNCLFEIGEEIKQPSILIPTSDEISAFVTEYNEQLSRYFIFHKNEPLLIKGLISKEGMYKLAKKHGVPTPLTVFPRNLDDVLAYVEDTAFPVMLKGIHGNRLEVRTGEKMVIVRSRDELIKSYMLLEEPNRPNLMIQEYIPGSDDQIYIFNGYFNEKSECIAAFTGRKIRQYPIHVGCASLGECCWNQKVADITIAFMQKLGYKGILDIGYRFDPRDGHYKVLDINPRIGQAFRLFTDENDMDVVRTLYMDLTGQKIYPIIPREGRRWVIENYDIISSLHYRSEDTLKLREWLRSFKNLEECAWFNWKDPLPFLMMLSGLLKRSLVWLGKRLRLLKRSQVKEV